MTLGKKLGALMDEGWFDIPPAIANNELMLREFLELKSILITAAVSGEKCIRLEGMDMRFPELYKSEQIWDWLRDNEISCYGGADANGCNLSCLLYWGNCQEEHDEESTAPKVLHICGNDSKECATAIVKDNELRIRSGGIVSGAKKDSLGRIHYFVNLTNLKGTLDDASNKDLLEELKHRLERK